MVKNQSRKKNTIYNFLVPLFITFGQIFLRFFEIRLFLSILGDEINGLQSMATQVLAYLNLVDLGVGSAFVFHLYKPIAEKNELRVSAVFNGAKIIMRRIGCVFTILLIVVAFIYPFFVKDVVDGRISYNLVVITIILLGMTSLSGYFVSAPESLFLTANQKGYIQRILALFSTLGIPLVSISIFSLIRFFPNYNGSYLYIAILIFKVVIAFSTSFIIALYTRRNYPFLYKYHDQRDTSIFGMTKDLLPHKISSLLVFNTTPILLSFFSTLKVVSIFNIYYMLTSSLCMLVSMALSAPQSSLGNLLNDDHTRFKKIFGQYETLSFFLVTVFSTLMLFGFYPFINWYLADKSDYSIVTLMVLFSIYFYFRNIRAPFLLIIDITGNYKKTKWISIIEAILVFLISFVGLSIFKTERVQLIVVSLAPVISYIVYDIFQMFLVNKAILHRSKKILILKWGISFFIFCLMILGFFLIFPFLKSIKWDFLKLCIYAAVLVMTVGIPVTIGYFLKKLVKSKRKVHLKMGL